MNRPRHLPALATLTGTILLTATSLDAQIPPPAPQPRTQPRAEWVRVSGVTGGPANRHWSQAAHSDGALFVFGGRTGTSGSGSMRNDLWVFETLGGGQWTELNSDGALFAPPERFRNTLSYDLTWNHLVMFGGEDAAGTLLGDTWVWDLSSGLWNPVSTPMAPSPRRYAQTAYDPSTRSVLLFGGQDGAGNALNDTWRFDGASLSWSQITTGTAPGPRGNHSLVTRSDFGDVFLCGGIDFVNPGRTHYIDAWVWNAGNGGWTQITPSTPAVPHGMAGNSTAYDPVRQRVILQGGQGISTNAGATGGAYGTQYGGSPSGWTSEFDCLTNEWLLYGGASFNDADPVIGRASRYYMAFLFPARKVYLWGGQDPSGRSNLAAVKEYQASPVADSSSVGSSCAGTGGSLVRLIAAARPWLGRVFVSQTNGLANGSLAFAIVGQPSPSTPLANLIPWGLPGCTLETTLDLPVAMTNNGGNAEFALTLPNDLSLAGAAVRQQTLQFEVGANIALSSSNALELVLGAL